MKINLISKSNLLALLVLQLAVASVAQAAQKCDADYPATTPTSRFTVNANQTVLDTKTGLIWKQCPQGLRDTSCDIGKITGHTWQEAHSLAEAEEFAGQTDWRLPDLTELLSIVERSCHNPAVNLVIFPIEQSWFFWSASTDADNINNAWGVDSYSVRRSRSMQPRTVHGAVRLVRGGKRP